MENTAPAPADRTYAHIVMGVVRETLTTHVDIHAVFPPSLIWLEITGMSPMPSHGWTYGSGLYSPPPAVVPASPKLTSLEFMGLLTASEQAGIAQAGQANAMVFLWLLKLAGAMFIDLGDVQTIGGVDALVAAGLLTSDRAKLILANMPPVVAATAVAPAAATTPAAAPEVTAATLNASYTASASTPAPSTAATS